MGQLFEASNLKIERAGRHIEELKCVLNEYANDDPTQASFTPATDTEKAQLKFSMKKLPMSVGAIVGDVVHNLRAALDLMAVELVSLDPNASTKGVYFPFCETAADLPKVVRDRNFHRAGQDAVDLLLTLKPYKGGSLALRALHDLDIQDKHHTLIANAANMTTPEVTVDTSQFPNLSIKMVEGSKGSYEIVFPPDSPLAGNEMVPALHDLVKLVQGILEAFARLIAARP